MAFAGAWVQTQVLVGPFAGPWVQPRFLVGPFAGPCVHCRVLVGSFAGAWVQPRVLVGPFAGPWVQLRFSVKFVLLIVLVFCVVLFRLLVYLRPVSFVPNVASFSGLSILDFPFGFL